MPNLLTTEEFINKAKKSNQNRDYDYSQTIYTGGDKDVTVKCNLHGYFTTNAERLVRQRSGCHICSGSLNTEEFVRRAKEVHSENDFDYSRTVYKNAQTKVEIFCKKHQTYFFAFPQSFLKTSGCKLCGKEKLIQNIKRSTKEEFIEKAKKIHGDAYSYEDVVYVNNHTKVAIFCKKHQKNFYQVPSSHVNNKSGCPDCFEDNRGKPLLVKTDKFIEKARKIHGDRYDYSLSECCGMNSKIKIICKIHGVFVQKYREHIHHKSNCPKCAFQKDYFTNEEYLEKVKKVHGDTYILDKIDYKDSQEKICVICRKHGEFFIEATRFLNRGGCPICGNNSYTTASFIEKLKTIYEDRYDYSLVEYKSSYEKVILICKEHGRFESSPSMLLRDRKTSFCCPIDREMTTEKYIQLANKVHNNKYDYSKFIYKGTKSKGTIICPEHGEMFVNSRLHLLGYGKCKYCGCKVFDTEGFKIKAKEIYGDKFNYDFVNYVDTYTKVKIICDKGHEILQSPSSFFCGNGCYKCLGISSKPEIQFLDYLEIKEEDRQKYIKPYRVDGFQNGIIYEFLGDYYHGNPEVFDPNKFNKTAKKTFAELHAKTFTRFAKLKSLGYTINYIWESDWTKFQKGEQKEPKIQIF